MATFKKYSTKKINKFFVGGLTTLSLTRKP